MKNLPFLLVLIVLTFTSCACHYYGFKSGLNGSTITGDDIGDTQPKIGLVAGGFAELCIDDYTSVQPEVLYSQQGVKYTDHNGFDGTLKLDYINVPVLVKFRASNTLVFEAGPQMGLLLSAKDKYESTSISGTDDIKDNYEPIDFGANLGLNYDLQNGWYFGARYYLGLSNINNHTDVNNKNGVLQFSVAFKFQ